MPQLFSNRRARSLTAALAFLLAAALPGSATANHLAVPTGCQSDVDGANDQPGQKDVTEFCIDPGNGAPCEAATSTNLDLITLTGGNTADVCSLYDTDNDNNVNLAVCITLGGMPATQQNVRLFTCGDSAPDKCTGSVQINVCTGGDSCLSDADCPLGETCSATFGTECESSQRDTDPFPSGASYPQDTATVCCIDLNDFGTPTARILDACSYPSQIPNSDPSDCILFDGDCDVNADCDDGNDCTADTCSLAGICQHTPNSGSFCDDGDACTLGSTCTDQGFCDGGSPVVCNDSNTCTTDTCNPISGCQFAPVANDTPCNDGQFCTTSDVCTGGICTGGAPPNCSDAIPCTIDTCNEATDSCEHTANNASCSNGAFCDGAEVCNVLSGCQPGTPVSCSDGVSCTIDTCNETTDTCDHAANNTACSNGQFCDGAEVCNLISGCQPGTAPNCNDGVTCTGDACNEATDQCDHTPNDAVCTNGLFCDGTETCDPLNDCEPGTPPICNDSVVCTGDACDEANDECDHVPNNALCNDGEFCNGLEVCDLVEDCEPGPDPCFPQGCNETLDQCVTCTNDSQCNNGLFCDGVETCNEGTGECEPGTPVVCNDGIACTTDSCEESIDACEYEPVDTACSNGLFCDGTETCDPVNGCEPGTPPNCNDGIACTGDACNEGTDQCDHTPNHAVCANGAFCDGVETCDPLAGCEPGTAVDCGDGVGCTIDTCNEATDACDHTANPALCNDGQFCTGIETCSPALDCQAGAPVVCNDGVTCTIDSCNEQADQCTSDAEDLNCSNGVFCDGEEECDPLMGCHSNPPADCNDGDACTVEACDESLDMCVIDDICCGNGMLDQGEDCEPPNDEDCNNGIDDDGDNRVDCDDFDSCADPNDITSGIPTCGEDCQIDPRCSRIGKDPAIIKFGAHGAPDRLKIHGRFRLTSNIAPEFEEVSFSLSNDMGSIYRGSLLPGDMQTSVGRYVFKDPAARHGNGVRDGIASLRLKLTQVEGKRYLSFIVIVYGDLSAATEALMTSQILVGNDIGYLRAEWTQVNTGWKLTQGDF